MTDTFDFSDWFSDKKEYHRMFVPDSPVMEYMALYAFNSGTLYETLLTEKMVCVSGDEAVFDSASGISYDEAFTNKTFDKIMFENYSQSGIVNTYFVEATKEKMLSRDYTDVIHSGRGVGGAINMHNEFVLLPSGSGYDGTEYFADEKIWNEKDEFVTDVQTSVNNSGLYWTVPLCFQFGTSGVDGMDCTKCSNVTFHLHLYDLDNAQSEKRTTALKGEGTNGPMLVAAPSTSYGSPGHTSSIPGRYEDVEEGGVDNPRNTVAAPIDLHYNQNTGMFESGTKSLVCVLLSDMEGISAGNVDVEKVHVTPITDMIMGAESDHYMGQHELGRAMPIGVKGSNPHHYGPDNKETGCKPSERKNVIVVVNRTSQKYTAGERILVQYIDGEWLIIQSMSPDATAEKTFTIGKWGPIFHGMAPATHFMRNGVIPQNRFPYHGETRDIGEGGFTPYVSEKYETSFRETFYYDLVAAYSSTTTAASMNNIETLGKYNGSGVHVFRPSPYYWQFTSFDQMSDDLGGNNDWNLLGNTNPLLFSTGDEPDENAETDDLYPFAGMTFPDGYIRTKFLETKRLSESAAGLHLIPSGKYGDQYLSAKYHATPFNSQAVQDRFGEPYCENAQVDPDNPDQWVGDEASCKAAGGTWNTGDLISPGGGKNANLRGNMFQVDKSIVNVPADIALNAGPNGTNGSPIESLAFLKECLNFGSDFHHKDMSIGGRLVQVDVQHDFYIQLAGPRVNLVNGVQKYLGKTGGAQDRYSWLSNDKAPGACSVSKSDGTIITDEFTCIAEGGTWTPNDGGSVTVSEGSVYDWEPINKTKVAFVPMTAEQYTSYDVPNPIFFAAGGGVGVGLGWPFPFEVPQPTLNGFKPVPRPFQLDIHGNKFFNRETGNAAPFDSCITSKTISAEGEGASETYNILPYLGMVGASPDAVNAYGTSSMRNVWGQSSATYSGKGDWADNGGYYQSTRNGLNTIHGAMAVGFTTSKLNVKTSALGLRFVVDMKDIGMDYLDNLSDPDNPTPQWGRRQDDQETINTTALWVRVADAWPAEQTIYDPRHHAIMNFHAGDLFSSVSNVVWNSGDGTLTKDGEPITDEADLPDAGAHPNPFSYKDGFYAVDQQDYDIDFRVPTYTDGYYVGEVAGKAVSPSDTVDSIEEWKTSNAGSLVDKDSKLRDKEHWRFNTIRRGMLLPFNWFQQTIGVYADGLKIVDGGTGYKKGEIMQSKGGEGGGGYFQITAIGSNGSITSLEPAKFTVVGGNDVSVEEYQPGFGYSHKDFGSSGVSLVNYTGGESSISNSFIAKGEGAEIYAMTGVIHQMFTTDSGVFKTRHQLLTAPSERGLRDPRHGRADTALITEMSIESPPANREYDLYFHFHNDISYTLLGEPSRSPDFMQYVTCEFSPTTL